MLTFLSRTVGQKAVIGLTGLGLCLFVLIHSAGNMLIFLGPESYNLYAHGLHEFFLMEVFEIGLLLLFAGHISLSLWLSRKNQKARGGKYKYSAEGEKKTSPAHTALVFQGVVLLVFLVWHLLTFKFGPYYETVHRGQTVRDIYRLVEEVFQNPLYVAGYSLALMVLSVHLARGFSASFRSLGFAHPRYISFIEKFGFLFSAVVSAGFLSQPLYVYFVLGP